MIKDATNIFTTLPDCHYLQASSDADLRT